MTSYAGHSDADLVDLARDGDRAAFAVLLHRTLSDTWTIASRGVTDVGRAARVTHAAYLDALRGLDGLAGSADPREAIRDLARRHAPAEATLGAVPAVALPAQLEDEVWRAIDVRWPDGRMARREVPWARLAVVLGLVVAAALLPVAVLGAPDLGAPTPGSTVAATPVDGPASPAPARTGPLPDYTFPTPPEVDAPPVVNADPGPAARPEAQGTVAPPDDGPEPAPAPAPSEAGPSETPSPEKGPTASPGPTPGLTPPTPLPSSTPTV